jgi:hypothetical protein
MSKAASHYTTTHAYNGEKRDSDYTITLETTSQPFGGLRWWFVCPRSGKRVSELHLPNGAYTFAYRLGYLSQRETPVIAQSLGASNSGIAWADTVESATTFESLNGCARTYERESARIDAAEKINNAYLLELVQRLQAKLLRRCVA